MSCALFEQALEVDAADRSVFVEKASEGDPVVRRLVLRMLEADGTGATALDRPGAALEVLRSAGDPAAPSDRSEHP